MIYKPLKLTIMKNAILYSLLLAVIPFVVSCEKENPFDSRTITGIGEIVTKSLELDPFLNIELEGVANLYVTVGGNQEVGLKAQQNIIDVLTWEVNSGTLYIGLEEGITLQNHEEIRFDIIIPELNSLVHDGVGDITLAGAGVEVFDITHNGIGHINAYEFPTDRCSVLTSAVGDCKVLVHSVLEVDISGIGDVYYKGSPEITETDTGLGSLINDN